jgi:hypothetical protein
MRPKYPVEAYAVAGGEFESTRIDWDDYERMGYTRHKLNSGHDENPSWPMHD